MSLVSLFIERGRRHEEIERDSFLERKPESEVFLHPGVSGVLHREFSKLQQGFYACFPANSEPRSIRFH